MKNFNINEAMGTIRSNMALPSGDRWNWNVIDILSEAPDHVLKEVLIPYIKGFLKDDHIIRVIPQNWIVANKTNNIKSKDSLIGNFWHKQYDLTFNPSIVLANALAKTGGQDCFFLSVMSEEICKNIKHITTDGAAFSLTDLNSIKESPFLGNIQSFKFGRVEGMYDYLNAFFRDTQSLKDVEELDLSRLSLSFGDMHEVFNSDAFKSIKRINLSGSKFLYHQPYYLTMFGFYQTLEDLDISWEIMLDPDIVVALISNHNRDKKAGFEHINLAHNRINVKLIKEIFCGKNTSKLKSLDLSGSMLIDKNRCLDVIINGDLSKAIEDLKLCHSNLESQDVIKILSSSNFKSLKNLQIFCYGYSDVKDVKELIDSGCMPKLESIKIHCPALGDRQDHRFEDMSRKVKIDITP